MLVVNKGGCINTLLYLLPFAVVSSILLYDFPSPMTADILKFVRIYLYALWGYKHRNIGWIHLATSMNEYYITQHDTKTDLTISLGSPWTNNMGRYIARRHLRSQSLAVSLHCEFRRCVTCSKWRSHFVENIMRIKTVQKNVCIYIYMQVR